MTDRELMQQALDALESECGATKSWIGEALRARLAQPEPEPLWIRNEEGKLELQVPLHFLDPAKVARLIDEAFERGKKEIDMEQVKDIAQKLADCALLNSAPPQPKQEPVAWMHDSHVGFNVPLYTAPPQREWQGLMDEDWIIGKRSADYIAGAEWAEAKLKEKNT